MKLRTVVTTGFSDGVFGTAIALFFDSAGNSWGFTSNAPKRLLKSVFGYDSIISHAFDPTAFSELVTF